MQPTKRRKVTRDIINYRTLLVKAYEYFELQALNKINSLTMNKHLDAMSASSKRKTECLGDIRLNKIRKLMDMYPGWERSEMQKRFHEGFLQAVALSAPSAQGQARAG